MCGLSVYVVTCSLIWLAPNMHDMHFWWQLPAPRRRRRLWGPSRISNGWMEQLGRTESWKRLKKKNMIKPRSDFKRIVSWIDIFLFATEHLDTKAFLMVFFSNRSNIAENLPTAYHDTNSKPQEVRYPAKYRISRIFNGKPGGTCGECFGANLGGTLYKLESGKCSSEKFGVFFWGVCFVRLVGSVQ